MTDEGQRMWRVEDGIEWTEKGITFSTLKDALLLVHMRAGYPDEENTYIRIIGCCTEDAKEGCDVEIAPLKIVLTNEE